VGGIDALGAPPVAAAHPRLAANLAPGAGPDAHQLALVLLPYPLLLAAVALLRRSGPWLLLLPPAAALAYAGALPQTAPPAVAVMWAETFAGDTHHRFVTLLRSSRGAGAALRLAPRGAHDLVVMPAGRRHRLQIDRDGTLVLAAPRALLRYREYRLAGVGRVPFRLGVSARGNRTRVDNAGPQASPPGWLLWRGAGYAIPALRPGGSQTVVYDPAAEPPPRPPATEIGAGPSVLVPLPWALPEAAHGPIHGTGWLWVRPVDELPA
jgi:hypothetical protein